MLYFDTCVPPWNRSPMLPYCLRVSSQTGRELKLVVPDQHNSTVTLLIAHNRVKSCKLNRCPNLGTYYRETVEMVADLHWILAS